MINYCNEEGCHCGDGGADFMPSLEELDCCDDCYLDHYYLEDVQQENFNCKCKCHIKGENKK